jgi:hypothetical protein
MATPEEIAAQFETPEPTETVETVETEAVEEPTEQLAEAEQPAEVHEEVAETEHISEEVAFQDDSSEEEKLEAARRGWKPDGTDKYGNHRTAKEFLERGTEISKIMGLERQVDKLNETLDLMRQHQETTAQRAYDRAIEDMKQEKREAAEIGDTQKMLDIDERIEKMEKPASIDTTGLSTEETNLAKEYETKVADFRAKHEWYEKDRVKTAFVNQEGAAYAQRVQKETGQVPHPEDVFAYVESELAKEFPNTQTTRVTTTQNRAVSRGSKKKGWSDVDDAAREIGKKLISRGAMTEEQYLKDYFGE